MVSRMGAPKPAELVEAPTERGKTEEQQRVSALVAAAATTLTSLKAQALETGTAVAVVANRVMRARHVHRALERELGDDAEVALIIGPTRGVTRERNAEQTLGAIKTGEARALAKPLVIVATQTIEAGVDIDLDGLVTEAAALDSLRQRFGRLNRGGREGLKAVAAVVAHKTDVGKKADDPVYGEAAAATWEWLNSLTDAEGTVDFGIDAMNAHVDKLAPGDLRRMLSPRPGAPILMPAHVDLYAQTSPMPRPTKMRDQSAETDPDLPSFLHGKSTDLDGVRIVWRADIETAQPDERVAAILAVAPPVSNEGLEINFPAAKAWLNGAFDDADSSDAAERDTDRDPSGASRRAYRWYGRDADGNGWIDPRELRPGDTIVVPVTYGGCDRYGWHPSSTWPVEDVGQIPRQPAAANDKVRRAMIRLNRRTLFNALQNDRNVPAEEVSDRADMLDVAVREILEESRELGGRRIARELCGDPRLKAGLPASLLSALQRAAKAVGLQKHFAYDEDGRPLTGAIFTTRPSSGREATITGDDRLGSTPGFPQGLDEHLGEVRDKAAAFTAALGLDPAIARDVALAGHLHDLGKADWRFQMMLYGGDAFAAITEGLRAKSDARIAGAWEQAKLPKGWRHEALSVRMALAHPLLAAAEDRHLVLWLIGTHHGFGRPFFPHDDKADQTDRRPVKVLGADVELRAGEGPQSLSFDLDDLNWPALFEVLKRRYGAWELARLEAIVRLADHRASEAAGRRPQNRITTDPDDDDATGDEADPVEEVAA